MPTILFGADVTHPPPGATGPGAESIAAVVASMDSFAVRERPFDGRSRVHTVTVCKCTRLPPTAPCSSVELSLACSRHSLPCASRASARIFQSSYAAEMVVQGERKEIICASAPRRPSPPPARGVLLSSLQHRPCSLLPSLRLCSLSGRSRQKPSGLVLPTHGREEARTVRAGTCYSARTHYPNNRYPALAAICTQVQRQRRRRLRSAPRRP